MEEGLFSKSKQAAILKITYQKGADQTTSFLICIIIVAYQWEKEEKIVKRGRILPGDPVGRGRRPLLAQILRF